MIRPARRRVVFSELPILERGCLFCLTSEGEFHGEEHVIPRSLGPDTDRFVIPPGVVCDACNSWLGRQVDAPFTDRFDMRLSRGLEGLRGRNGGPPLEIDGLDATARLDVEIGGGKVTIYAASAEPTGDGGLDIEVRPTRADPADIVARTVRALWKIALGMIWLTHGKEALDPRWDHLRRAVLGTPFTGYLLQDPFTVKVTRRLDVNLNIDAPDDPWSMVFVLGGVALAAPLADGATVAREAAHDRGWEVHPTDDVAPRSVYLRLDPDK